MTATHRVPWALQRRRLERASDYWLSTTRPDGRPHVVPLWGVWLDGGLYFSTDPASVKGRNLAAEPRAAVHIDGGHDVLVVEGTTARVHDDTVHARVDDAMAAKYVTPDGTAYRLAMDPPNRLWVLHPERALAWWEALTGPTFTRWVWNGGPEPRPADG